MLYDKISKRGKVVDDRKDEKRVGKVFIQRKCRVPHFLVFTALYVRNLGVAAAAATAKTLIHVTITDI